MAKASLLFHCLMVLFLIALETGCVNACQYKCKSVSASDCKSLQCFRPGCKKYCLNGCCLCGCNGNEMLDHELMIMK
ncbi:hypothetical protein VIGAN_05182700 [Vigna angularis var. angularis]|uniref:Uncharacterized protein n=1 Tax=Vigna angularis var. angularis TaxID=157739 RepID=A0A0S3S6C5_PHAAN|nr:hypothetical protein VIGAN_05182700 [Vigna angularis var. angularis]